MSKPILKWLGGVLMSAGGYGSTPPPGPANLPYESAGYGRRSKNWNAPGTGPNMTLYGALITLRNRSKAGYRNNPWIRRGIESLVSNEVGVGIVPRSRAEDEAFRAAANALWAKSVDELDADGILNFYGQQALSSRTRNMAGEAFLRRRRRRSDFGTHVPLQVQLLEPDFVPHTLNEVLRNGNRVRQGIELDKRGQRVAYWMYKSHPNDGMWATDFSQLIRVPASDVIHHYIPLRPGQLRGEPVTAQALLKAHTFDSYDDAELVRKQSRAPYTGFIKKSYTGEEDWQYDPLTGERYSTDSEGVANISVEAGTMLSGLPGEEPVLFDGDDTGAGYADFMRQQILGMATGIGVPYEILSGDWSKVNDRLMRAILQEFRRHIEAAQDHLMIFQVCQGVWRWWMDAAVMSGALAAPDYQSRRSEYQAHEWRPHGWPYLNPLQDVQAKKEAIAANLTSTEAEVAKTGYDVEDIVKQNIKTESDMVQKRREAGLADYPADGKSAPRASASGQSDPPNNQPA